MIKIHSITHKNRIRNEAITESLISFIIKRKIVSTTSTEDPLTTEDISTTLAQAKREGRNIVPIIGAGLSADSGFPVISVIDRYFGKLYKYIKLTGFLAPKTDLDKSKDFDPLARAALGYIDRPWEYIRDFHWPDRFQLNQDLWTHLQEGNPPQTISEAVREGQLALLEKINPEKYSAFNETRDELTKLGVTFATEISNSFNGKGSNNYPYWLFGDWRKVIQYFTQYQPDDADALFTRFGLNRLPSLGHRFLAFLIRDLQIQTIFTFNFDSLIEQSLTSTGMKPDVFSMESGIAIPSYTHLRDHLSLIKLHGSTHSILVDERLDHPLSEAYKRRFDKIVGDDPLLFVVGSGAADYRLCDLVNHVLDRKKSSDSKPAVVWLHYESTPPKFLQSRKDPRVICKGTNNPGLFLFHIHGLLTGVYPASEVAYLSHIQKPIKLDLPTKDDLPDGVDLENILSSKNGFLFSSLNQNPENPPLKTASQSLFLLATHLSRKGFHTVWVDLESVHTIAGVIGTIIDQCRAYDSTLPPAVMALGEDQGTIQETIKIGVTRIKHALSRTRYLLAFDGLETYVWPATSHHGITHVQANSAIERIKNLISFINELATKNSGESVLAVAVDQSKIRHAASTDSTNNLDLLLTTFFEELSKSVENWKAQSTFQIYESTQGQNTYEALVSFSSGPSPVATVNQETLDKIIGSLNNNGVLGNNLPERIHLTLFYLSCFRRTRTLIALQLLLRPLWGSDENVRLILKLFCEISELGFYRLEGGGYWFNRTLRDYIYGLNTQLASTNLAMQNILVNLNENDIQKTVFQLFLSAIAQQQIARIYYTRTYVQSNDTFCLLEFTYHRASSIRFLTKILFIIEIIKKNLTSNPGLFNAFKLGIQNVGNYLKDALGSDPNNPSLQKPLKTAIEFDDEAIQDEFHQNISKLLWTTQIDSIIPEDIQKEFAYRHQREIFSLYQGWVRSESRIRASIPAEQLLNWCKTLIEDDLIYRFNRVVTGYNWEDSNKLHVPILSHPNAIDPTSAQSIPINPDAEQTVLDFRNYLIDFQVKILIERSDFVSAVDLRAKEKNLKFVKDLIEFKLDENVKIPVLKCKINELKGKVNQLENITFTPRELHYLLDVSICFIRKAQLFKAKDDELTQVLNPGSSLLNLIEEKLNSLSSQMQDLEVKLEVKSELHEARLRLVSCFVDLHLKKMCVFSHSGFNSNWLSTSNQEDLSQAESTEALDRVTEGLSRVRTQFPQASRPPRTTLIDSAPDGTIYPQYRSIFHMLQGRATWMNGKKIIKGLNSVEEKWLMVETKFNETFREFELARGGIGKTDSLIAGLVEFYTVEARLAFARLLLDPHNWNERSVNSKNGTKSPPHPLDEVRSHYEAARIGLQQMRHFFLAGHRNVIWWRVFFRLVTQYHADRLVLGYARFAQDCLNHTNTTSASKQLEMHKSLFPQGDLPTFLRRLSRGYHALKSAIDFNLPETDNTTTSNWVSRMWWELTLSGFAMWRLSIRAISDLNNEEHRKATQYGDNYILSQLGWLNQSANLCSVEKVKRYLENTISQNVNDPITQNDIGAFHLLNTKLNSLLETNQEPKDIALSLRSIILELANRKALNESSALHLGTLD